MNFAFFYFEKSYRSARVRALPPSSPFLYQSLRSRAPQRGPRATWQGLVEERRGRGLGAGNAAAAMFDLLRL